MVPVLARLAHTSRLLLLSLLLGQIIRDARGQGGGGVETCFANVSYVLLGDTVFWSDDFCYQLRTDVGDLIPGGRAASGTCETVAWGRGLSFLAELPVASSYGLIPGFVQGRYTDVCGSFVTVELGNGCNVVSNLDPLVQFTPDVLSTDPPCAAQCEVAVRISNGSSTGYRKWESCNLFAADVSRIAGIDPGSFACYEMNGLDMAVKANLHAAASEALLQGLNSNNNDGATKLLYKHNYDCLEARLDVEVLPRGPLAYDSSYILHSCGSNYTFKVKVCDPCRAALPYGLQWLNMTWSEVEESNVSALPRNGVACMDGQRVLPTLQRFCRNGECNNLGTDLAVVESFSDVTVLVRKQFSTVGACCSPDGVKIPGPIKCNTTWDLGDTFMIAPSNVFIPVPNVSQASVSGAGVTSHASWAAGSTDPVPLRQFIGPQDAKLQSVAQDCQAGVIVQMPGQPGYVRLAWDMYGPMPPPPPDVPPVPPAPPPQPSFEPPVSSGGGDQASSLAIGLAIGLGVLAVCLAGILAVMLYRRHKKKQVEAAMGVAGGKSKPDSTAAACLSPPSNTTLSDGILSQDANGSRQKGLSSSPGPVPLVMGHEGRDELALRSTHMEVGRGLEGAVSGDANAVVAATAVGTPVSAPTNGDVMGSRPAGLPPLPPGGRSGALSHSSYASRRSNDGNVLPSVAEGVSQVDSAVGGLQHGCSSSVTADLGVIGQGQPTVPLTSYSSTTSFGNPNLHSPSSVLSPPGSLDHSSKTTGFAVATVPGFQKGASNKMLPTHVGLAGSDAAESDSAILAVSPERAGLWHSEHAETDPGAPPKTWEASSQLFSAYQQLAANILVNNPVTEDDSISSGPSSGASWLQTLQKSESVRKDVDLGMEFSELDFEPGGGGLLGAGAVGSVYRASFRGQPVAVKVITQTVSDGHFAGPQGDSDSIYHEIQILARLSHPNIVHLFGGCLRPPRVFIVEELMTHTLSTVIHKQSGRVLSLERVLVLAMDVARGLEYLHSKLVIHRDLKPANILLDKAGVAKISDFGLARCKYKTYLQTKQTDAGTVAYMAPEAFNPDIGGISTKCDIFSFAVILWEMLAQRYPWDGQPNMVIIYRVAVQHARCVCPPDDPYFPKPLVELIEKCWHQTPRMRPNIAEVLASLEAIAESLGVDTTPRRGDRPAPLSREFCSMGRSGSSFPEPSPNQRSRGLQGSASRQSGSIGRAVQPT